MSRIPNTVRLSRKQVKALLLAQNHFFPCKVRKGDTVQQRCGHPGCDWNVRWTVPKKGTVEWSEELVDHIHRNEHYRVYPC